MKYMFYYCESLLSIDLNHLDTFLVTNMVSMFENCYSLISLDLSNLNTFLVTNIEFMLYYCKSLLSFAKSFQRQTFSFS